MQKNTKLKRGAVLSALAVAAFFLVYFALLAAAVLELPEDTTGLLILLLMGAVFLAIIAGVLLALRQRLKEIDSGEEADAKKY